MNLPLLTYRPVTQNHRVTGYEITGDESTLSPSADQLLSADSYDVLIRSAYRQIFNEQQLLEHNRQKDLESQLRNGQITVQQFIRGLALSETFQVRNYQCSNNYRFVQLCVQRLLGRDVYSDQEKYVWSTVLATRGLVGFIDSLLESEEYQVNFGNGIVPYQRRRILPQRDRGDVTFAHTPRYAQDHLAQLESLGYFQNQDPVWDYTPTSWQMKVASVVVITGIGLLGVLVVATALAAWGIISL